jgi:hypothetical protein
VGWASHLSLRRRRSHSFGGEIRCVGLVNLAGDKRHPPISSRSTRIQPFLREAVEGSNLARALTPRSFAQP